MPFLLAALILASSAAPAAGAADGYARYNRVTRFDAYFSKYSKRYFGVAFDWRYFKAQAVAESNLRTDARSAAGAAGIMQIMPRTFAEIRSRHRAIEGGIDDPRWNIAAGIWYDRQHFVAWTSERPFDERLKFMFGSYNAGRGNILRAQRVAEGDGLDAVRWAAIEQGLPRVTGRRSRETIAYVDRIFLIKKELR